MNNLRHKLHNFRLRKQRVRSVVSGTTARPRLSVYISNRHITAQIVDDTRHSTIVYATTTGRKVEGQTMTERSAWVGKEIAKKAKAAKIKQVVFDRSGKLYHGKVQALADAARAEGLEF